MTAAHNARAARKERTSERVGLRMSGKYFGGVSHRGVKIRAEQVKRSVVVSLEKLTQGGWNVSKRNNQLSLILRQLGNCGGISFELLSGVR